MDVTFTINYEIGIGIVDEMNSSKQILRAAIVLN